MPFKVIPKALLVMLACFSLEAYSREFICKANSPSTELYFMGDIFKLNVDKKCLNLSKLTDKKDSWSWKVVQSNSLGDFDLVRNFCDGNDLGMVGQPAHWDERKKTLSVYSPGRANPSDSFICYENK